MHRDNATELVRDTILLSMTRILLNIQLRNAKNENR